MPQSIPERDRGDSRVAPPAVIAVGMVPPAIGDFGFDHIRDETRLPASVNRPRPPLPGRAPDRETPPDPDR